MLHSLKTLGIGLTLLVLAGVGCETFDQSVGVVPTSGRWSFSFESSGAVLQGPRCPTETPGGIGAGGEAILSVTDDGQVAVMDIDGQTLVFLKQSGDEMFYQTGTRLFPVRSGTGTVSFDFIANTQDSIVGTLHWNNNVGCRGEYPFTMVLLEFAAETPSTTPYLLEEGNWNFNTGDILNDCAANIAGFSNLPTTVEVSHVADLDTGAPIANEILLEPFGVILAAAGNTNAYGQTGGGFDVGTPVDSVGDVLLDFENETFTGVIEAEATSETGMSGTLYISSDTCGMAVTFSMILP